jgi:hypothetical protein
MAATPAAAAAAAAAGAAAATATSTAAVNLASQTEMLRPWSSQPADGLIPTHDSSMTYQQQHQQ